MFARTMCCAGLAMLVVCGELAGVAVSAEVDQRRVRVSKRTEDHREMRSTHEAFLDSEAGKLEVLEHAGPEMNSPWEGELAHGEEDIFAHVRPLIEHQEANRDSVQTMSLVETGASAAAKAETGVGKVHAFCEICILIMQMKERGQPHLCAGLNPDYFISVRSIPVASFTPLPPPPPPLPTHCALWW